jgi:serine/threonine protein kinase
MLREKRMEILMKATDESTAISQNPMLSELELGSTGVSSHKNLEKDGGNVKTPGVAATLSNGREGSNASSTTPMVITYADKIQIMHQCTSSVAYLHSLGFVHCDIKSLNYLVTKPHPGSKSFLVKLSDFGDCKQKDVLDSLPEDSLPPIPSRNWCPPELLGVRPSGRAYTMESDVYSLAIVLFEVAALVLPYEDRSHEYSPEMWLEAIIRGVRPTLPSSLPVELRSVIQRAWATLKEDRSTAQELLAVLDKLV